MVLGWAGPALQAQAETFVQAARALSEMSEQTGSLRSSGGILTVVERMAVALAEWDRTIAEMEGRASREAGTASDRQAYQRRVELGVTYAARGRRDDALKQFDAAVALQPPASDVQVLRALVLEAGGRTEEAAKAFRAAWSADSRNAVKAYYVAQRPGTSPAEHADAERARTALTTAYQNLEMDNRAPAVAPFMTLGAIPDMLSRTPVVGDASTARGFALLAEGHYDEAVAALKQAAAGKTVSDEQSPLARFARGQQDEAANRVPEARREYQAALAGALAGRSVLHVAIARLAQVEGDLPAAIDAFAAAVRLTPNDRNIHREFAAAYVADGRTDAAFGELMAALLVDRRDGQAHADLGQLYLDTGRDADAVTAFNRALMVNPERYEVRYALATAHTRLGHAAEAARQLDLFERARREALDRRRRAIASEVEQEEDVRRGAPKK